MEDLMNFQPVAASDNLVSRDWTSDMIAPLSDRGQGTAASFVAKTFNCDGVDTPAELFISDSAFIAASSMANGSATTF
ncbi:hypothetical protein AJ87_45030 [Rhizobium yanglingense]|nr:hypothetical protein AJ87_45030 [Rhizobium yanglingense]